MRRDQLSQAMAVGRNGPVMLLVIIGALTLISLQWHSPIYALTWGLSAYAIAASASLIGDRIFADVSDERPYRPLLIGYIIRSSIIVASVASAGPFLWVPGDMGNHMFILLVLLMSANVIVAKQSMHLLAALPTAIYILTAICMCLIEGGALYVGLSVMAVIMFAFLVTIGLRASSASEAMTRLRHREQDLMAQQQMMIAERETLVENLRAASRSKADFFARMSHELRTPLNAIIGFSDLMKSDALGPAGSASYMEYAGYIHSSGTHLLHLINDILDLSKIEAGKMEIRESRIDLRDAIHDATLMVRLKAEEGGITLTNRVAQGIELMADETFVRQIALNVVSNAIKFTPPGGHVMWSVENDLVNDQLVIKLSDTGCGIPEDQIDTVFEPFKQVKGAFAPKERGTGLGLPIVRSLMQLHGGDASIAATPGGGTTVVLRFPAHRIVSGNSQRAA